MAKQDALRASLDQRQVDRKAGRERDYMESVLRRIGATAEDTGATPAKTTAPASAQTEAPAFDRVKPVKHPKKGAPEGAVEFRQLTAKEKKAKKKALKQQRKERDEEEPVVWQDVTEGADPDRTPDPKAGYMKGNYALLRRQIDSDHAVYFFATEVPDDAEQTRVPSGYEVRLTEETRLPYIARRGSNPELNQTVQVRAKDRDEAIEIAANQGVGGLHAE